MPATAGGAVRQSNGGSDSCGGSSRTTHAARPLVQVCNWKAPQVLGGTNSHEAGAPSAGHPPTNYYYGASSFVTVERAADTSDEEDENDQMPVDYDSSPDFEVGGTRKRRRKAPAQPESSKRQETPGARQQAPIPLTATYRRHLAAQIGSSSARPAKDEEEGHHGEPVGVQQQQLSAAQLFMDEFGGCDEHACSSHAACCRSDGNIGSSAAHAYDAGGSLETTARLSATAEEEEYANDPADDGPAVPSTSRAGAARPPLPRSRGVGWNAATTYLTESRRVASGDSRCGTQSSDPGRSSTQQIRLLTHH